MTRLIIHKIALHYKTTYMSRELTKWPGQVGTSTKKTNRTKASILNHWVEKDSSQIKDQDPPKKVDQEITTDLKIGPQ